MSKTQFIYSLKDFANWLSGIEYSSIAVISDENTSLLCLPKLQKAIDKTPVSITVKGGEKHKTLADCETIWQGFMDKKIDRNSLIINLGGGMITDIGGFAAATFKRGVSFVNIPTTLLGMVDASIGNKTGLNFKGIKNQIGTFSQAESIVIDSDFLQTLPDIEFKSGMGEVLKYGFIQDPKLLIENKANKNTIKQSTIEHCVDLKQKVVAQDPTENGWRQILNFGHTIGHALESYSLHINAPMKHGEAVAWGMLAECYLSQIKLGFKSLSQSTDIIKSYFATPTWFSSLDFEAIHEYAKHDKKNKGGEINCTLLHDFGKPEVGFKLSRAEFIDALKWLQNLA